MGGEQRAARQNKRGERGQVLVEPIDGAFETVDLLLSDTEFRAFRFMRLDGHAQVRADIEKILLHAEQLALHVGQELRPLGLRAEAGDDDADGGVGLIDIAVRGDARRGLGDHPPITEHRHAPITDFGVDLGKTDHAGMVAERLAGRVAARHTVEMKIARLLAKVLALIASSAAMGHPGDGIAVAGDGTVYFSDVVRNVIWKADARGELSAFARGLHSHSIAMDKDGNVWAEHLRSTGEAGHIRGWERTLLRIAPTGERSIVLGPTFGTHDFGGSPFTCDADGAVVSLTQRPFGPYSLRRVTSKGTPEPLADEHEDPIEGVVSLRGTIGGICAWPAGGYMITQGMAVLRMHDQSRATLIASLAARPLPADATSTRVHALWGVAADEKGTFIYVTDWDARTVHKIGERGAVSEFARSPAPWSPTGVAVQGEKVYVLEHGLENDHNLGPRVRVIDANGGGDRVIATVE